MIANILIRFDDICTTMDFKQFHIAEYMMNEDRIKLLIGAESVDKAKNTIFGDRLAIYKYHNITPIKEWLKSY